GHQLDRHYYPLQLWLIATGHNSPVTAYREKLISVAAIPQGGTRGARCCGDRRLPPESGRWNRPAGLVAPIPVRLIGFRPIGTRLTQALAHFSVDPLGQPPLMLDRRVLVDELGALRGLAGAHHEVLQLGAG